MGHKKMKQSLIALALIFHLSGSAGWAAEASRSSIEARLALESSLEKRVQMVLSEALGTSDIIVIISAEPQEEKKKQAFDFLPGVPEREKVGEISLSSSLTMIKKISATLILDRNISDSDSKLAKKLTAGLLGLPQEREDLVTLEKMDFRKARPFAPSDLLLPPNLWNLIWTLLAAVLGIFTVFSFFKPFALNAKDLVGVLAAKANGDQGDRGPDRYFPAAGAASDVPSAGGKESRGTDPDRKRPFWFLTPENAGNLAFILKTRPAEDITIVLSYAPEAVAANLIEALYPKSMEALAGLPKATLMPEARIKGLEAELVSALDYVVGSEDKTMEIIEQLPDNIQNAAILSFSTQNPAFSRKLSAGIVRFSDMKNLEPAHAQLLTRRMPMRNLALALKNSDLAQPFLEKLSAGMQERFRQELDLTRNPTPEAQRAERVRVARELKKLVSEGFVVIGKSSQGARHTVKAAAPKSGDQPAAPVPAAPPPAEKKAEQPDKKA